jgi:ParB-like chromosome segregation protein Spo0J
MLDSITPAPTQHRFHPLATSFPLLEGAEFDELVADVWAHGLLEPIVVLEDMILDGRNRYRACQAAGVEPTFIPYCGDDPAAFVVSANLHRRHLTQEQKRELAARLLKTQPQQSNRVIAKTARVDHKTVGAVRAELEATGEIPQLEKTTGADGKARPVLSEALKAQRMRPKSIPITAQERERRCENKQRLEVDRFAARLATNDPDSARTLHKILYDDQSFALMVALERELGIEP